MNAPLTSSVVASHRNWGALVAGLVFCASAGLASCAGAEKVDPGPEKCDVPKLFASRCSDQVCHSPEENPDPEEEKNLDLVSPGLEARLVGIQGGQACDHRELIVAGDPDNSFLYQKLALLDPGCGRQMPQGDDKLSAAELKCVREYILNVDAGPSCETCGGQLCIELSSDAEHCGTCETACGEGMVCAEGVCINPCTSSETLCGSSCIDAQTDELHCGRCGHRCGPGTTCVEGACSCDADLPVVSFKDDIQTIFKASCGGAKCHTGTENDVTTLKLGATVAYDQLVGVASEGEGCTVSRVTPGNADQSFLLDKLMGGSLCYGKRMPLLADDPLSVEAIAKVVSWVCAGAAED